MTAQNYKDEVIWIIGASSGIGHALALELAAAGAKLMLSARRKNLLDELQAEIGAQHMVFPLDVADTAMTARTAQAIVDANGRIDRVIFMSAAYTPMSSDTPDMTVIKNIIDVNLMGAFNVVHAVLPLMKAQKFGQIALCGSVAGYVGLPNGQPYCATKAAIISLAESLRVECDGIVDIKLISPGFVKTPLTDRNSFPMPMMISAERAAQAIAKGLRAKSFEIHFPKTFTFLLKFLELLPYPLKFMITRGFR